MFIISFDTDPQNFDPKFPLQKSVAETLVHVVEKVIRGEQSGVITGINGERIGSWRYSNLKAVKVDS